LLSFRKLWDVARPSVADIKKVRKVIPKVTGTIRLGGMTDCFQPCERDLGVTYELIKCLNEYRKHYLIVTKSDLVADDKYIAVLDKELAHVQITITSTDNEVSSKFEKAPLISKRIEAAEKLNALGFDTSIRLSPYIPQYVNKDIINKINCDKLLMEFLRVNTWISRWFDIDFSRYNLKSNGYLHLQLEDKVAHLEGLYKKQMSICEDVDEHFNFWKDTYNYNKDDCCNLRS